MKKIFTKKLSVYMIVALSVTIISIFMLQTIVCNSNNNALSKEKLATVKEKLASNDENIELLTKNLGENNLVKARAFADLIEADRLLIYNTVKFKQLVERLGVSEIHVIDENGIITHSTVDEYVGFDMKSGEQSEAFMVIIDDPTIEIVQEPQLNVAKSIYMQYIGVARTDAKGMVQVGVRPEILESILESTEIDKVIADFDFGNTGYVYAVDGTTGEVVAHPNKKLIGKKATKVGISTSKNSKGKARINNISGYYVNSNYNDMIIGTFMPASEYYSDRLEQTIVVSISLIIIFGILLYMIQNMVNNKIVRGINRIISGVKEIAEGNLDLEIKEQENPEFISLSRNINKMVGNIRSKIDENKDLLEKQNSDMENTMSLIENIKGVCVNLGDSSQKTLSNADIIYKGTEEQASVVDDLKNVLSGLTDNLNESVDVAISVASNTKDVTKSIEMTQEQMLKLKSSIEKINEMSIAIEQIIDEINSISQQTNMLSLNASIEAARAGEMGRGFAVVAMQVGELATRSAKAAKETSALIMNSIQAVEEGKSITDETVKSFINVVSDIENANKDVTSIAEMVRDNANSIGDLVEEIDKISDVVDRNVEISQSTQVLSGNVAEVADRLLQLVE